MENVNGVISAVSKKPWTDRNTGKEINLYSFQIQGSNRWLRTGTNPLPFGQGQAVQFVQDGQNVDVATMKAATDAPAVTAPAPSANGQASSSAPTQGSGSTTSGYKGYANKGAFFDAKDAYWDTKEARDIAKDERYQNVDIPRMTMSVSIQAAALVVDSALKHDALSFGTMAKSKRQGQLVAFVNEVAGELYNTIVNAPNRVDAPVEAATGETDDE